MTVRFLERLKPLLVPIDSVKQHPDNPNNGDLDALIESIEMNGFTTVVTVDQNTGYILAGNHRYQALHALGSDQIPVVYADYDEAGSIRYLVGDNATGQKAVMDEAHLLKHLKFLHASDAGLIGSGFTEGDFERKVTDAFNREKEQVKADLHGEGYGPAMKGVYQVIVEFDDEDDRDEALASLTDRYDGAKVRAVNF